MNFQLFKNNFLLIESNSCREIYRKLLKDFIDSSNVTEDIIDDINREFRIKDNGNFIIANDNKKFNNFKNKIKNNKSYTDNALFEYKNFCFFVNYSQNDTIQRIKRMAVLFRRYNDVTYEFKDSRDNIPKLKKENISKNTILFGAPGTGKSHFIKEILNNHMIDQEFIFRTTFYEEYSYFDFVGQFKPTMIYNDNNTVLYRRTPEKINNDVKRFGEPSVIYEFVSGVFINAYLKAKSNPEQNVYLIIEEINRGNAPAIFGEFFQSLDRDVEGESKYDIKVSQELKQHIQQNLNEKELNKETPEYNFSLPKNLFILATMNTSDQSLFKMDTAFKRRWSMKYHPISFENTIFEGLMIEDSEILWKDFIVETNKLILNVLNNEDKMIGQFFCTEFNGVISKDDFSDKLLHYLFFDVFRFNRSEVFETESFSELYKKKPEDVFELIKKALN